MKSKFFISLMLFFFFANGFLPSFSQTAIQCNASQQVTVSGRGFYPFEGLCNTEFKEFVQEDPSFSVTITDFQGSPVRIAPAKDFMEIGKKKRIKGDGVYPLNFKKAKKHTNTAGLSFSGGHAGSPTTFFLEIGPTSKGNCTSPVSCDTDCSSKFGKCCEADPTSMNAIKWCNPTGVGNACGCINKR